MFQCLVNFTNSGKLWNVKNINMLCTADVLLKQLKEKAIQLLHHCYISIELTEAGETHGEGKIEKRISMNSIFLN